MKANTQSSSAAIGTSAMKLTSSTMATVPTASIGASHIFLLNEYSPIFLKRTENIGIGCSTTYQGNFYIFGGNNKQVNILNKYFSKGFV